MSYKSEDTNGAMKCECEVIDFDGGAMSFYDRAIAFNLHVYEHKFMTTIEVTKRGPHQGHNWKYMEVEGRCHVLLNHCSHMSWITRLPRRQYDFRLSIPSGDIGITQYTNDWGDHFTIFIMWLICLAVLYQDHPG